MKKLTEYAYAKINLHLEVIGKRADGYHEVESLMHAISLRDTVKVEPAEGEGISLVCSDPTLSSGEDNLVMRAARAFYRRTGLTPQIKFTLTKVIPSRAGLGGGSSDAAATLRVLNRLHDSPLDSATLHELAAALGADVPFCIEQTPKLATGIGTVLAPAPALHSCLLLLAIGEEDAMSTKDAYAAIDQSHTAPRRIAPLVQAMNRARIPPAVLSGYLYNRFEALNPQAMRGMAMLRENGADAALLCGSGAAFVGFFADHAHRQRRTAEAALKAAGYRTFLAVPKKG